MPLDNAAALGPGQPDPTGGVPQSDTEKVARGLVGDEMVNRYGDVLGVRKSTWADTARDFALGAAADPRTGKPAGIAGADAAKQQIRDQYDKSARQAERAGIARADEARKNNQTFAEGMKTSRRVPKARRKDYIRELATQSGLKIDSPAVINALADSDLDFAALFEDPEVQKMMKEDPTGFNAKLQAAGASGNDLIDLKLGHDQADQKKQAAEDAHALNAAKITLANAQAAKAMAGDTPKLTSSTRTMHEAASSVLPLLDDLEAHLDRVKTGPVQSRYQTFAKEKVGAENPEWAGYLANADLASTLMMRMHVGARGSDAMLKHFSNMLDVRKQPEANVRAVIAKMRTYANRMVDNPSEGPPTIPGPAKVKLGGGVPPGIKAIAKTLKAKVDAGDMTEDEARAQMRALATGGAGS